MHKELSIFIDESGKFGSSVPSSDFYIISFIIHDQSADISSNIEYLNIKLKDLGLRKNFNIHAGPIIRNDGIFKNMTGEERRKLFASGFAFLRYSEVYYESFIVEKKYYSEMENIMFNFSKQIEKFIDDNTKLFSKYDRVKIYYDNGRMEVKRLVSDIFGKRLSNVEFKPKVTPSKYKLQQSADMVCTLELVRLKIKNNKLTKSEEKFFRNRVNLRNNYLKPLSRKHF